MITSFSMEPKLRLVLKSFQMRETIDTNFYLYILKNQEQPWAKVLACKPFPLGWWDNLISHGIITYPWIDN
jgi:hypothetical protein